MSNSAKASQPLTMIVRHRVDAGKCGLFDDWAKGIRESAKTFAGFLGTEVIRPLELTPSAEQGEHGEYVCIIRFDSYDHLAQWVDSPQRQHWIAKTSEFSSEPPQVEQYHSLEFWFDSQDKKTAPPPRYKMAILSFLVIWVQVTLLVPPIADWVGGPHVLVAAVAVAIIVLLTTYLVMPIITRLLKGWLFR